MLFNLIFSKFFLFWFFFLFRKFFCNLHNFCYFEYEKSGKFLFKTILMMSPIFGRISTSKIAGFGMMPIRRSIKWQCILRMSLFEVNCGPAASSVQYFFENDDGERYRSMITNFFWSKLDYIDVNDMWFQHGAAALCTPHS